MPYELRAESADRNHVMECSSWESVEDWIKRKQIKKAIICTHGDTQINKMIDFGDCEITIVGKGGIIKCCSKGIDIVLSSFLDINYVNFEKHFNDNIYMPILANPDVIKRENIAIMNCNFLAKTNTINNCPLIIDLSNCVKIQMAYCRVDYCSVDTLHEKIQLKEKPCKNCSRQNDLSVVECWWCGIKNPTS